MEVQLFDGGGRFVGESEEERSATKIAREEDPQGIALLRSVALVRKATP